MKTPPDAAVRGDDASLAWSGQSSALLRSEASRSAQPWTRRVAPPVVAALIGVPLGLAVAWACVVLGATLPSSLASVADNVQQCLSVAGAVAHGLGAATPVPALIVLALAAVEGDERSPAVVSPPLAEPEEKQE